MITRTCSLAEAIVSLPMTLGYHPAASLVVVLRREEAVAMTMRLDDDAVHAHPQACLDAVIRAADALPGVTSCDLVAYRSLPGVIDLATLAALFGRAVPVQHVGRVDGERWWVEPCAVVACTVDAHPTAERSAVLSAAASSSVPPSRDDACAPLRVTCPELKRAVDTAMAAKEGVALSIREVRAAWREAVAAGARGSHELPRSVVDALATVLLCVTDGQGRDEMTGAIVPALHCGDGKLWSSPPSSRALLHLLRAVPDAERAEWLAFVALARWREGDGPGALLAAQEANAHHVRCGLPALVLEVVSSGMTHAVLTRRRRSRAAAAR